MRVKVITPPAAEPVTASQLREHLRIDSDAEDDYLLRKFGEARTWAEGYLRRAIAQQTLEVAFDEIEEPLILPYAAPLVSITSMKYLDSSGVEQTLSTSVYSVDDYSEPARISLAYDQSWPTYRSIPNTIKVRYVAGYASDAVPTPIITGLELLTGDLYTRRENSSPVRLETVPLGALFFLNQYRLEMGV